MAYNTSIKITLLVCESGMVIKIRDIDKISTKPFEKIDQTASALRGDIEEGHFLYLKMHDETEEIVNTHNKINFTVSEILNQREMFKSILRSWQER